MCRDYLRSVRVAPLTCTFKLIKNSSKRITAHGKIFKSNSRTPKVLVRPTETNKNRGNCAMNVCYRRCRHNITRCPCLTHGPPPPPASAGQMNALFDTQHNLAVQRPKRTLSNLTLTFHKSILHKFINLMLIGAVATTFLYNSILKIYGCVTSASLPLRRRRRSSSLIHP